MVSADFSSLREVSALALHLQATYKTLDVLINNAGLITMKPQVSKEGFELTFGVNYLAPYLLTTKLLPLLKKSPDSRIIMVATKLLKPIPLHLDTLTSVNSFSLGTSYLKSKMALLLFTQELAKRLAGSSVTVNAFHPGVVNTEIGRDMKGPFKILLTFFKRFFLSSRQGALTAIYLASSPAVAKENGMFFIKNTKIELPSDPETSLKLWELSEKLTTSF